MIERVLIPTGRVGQIEEIARLIAFLCDNHATGYITGQTIVADGGLSLAQGGLDHEEVQAVKQKLP